MAKSLYDFFDFYNGVEHGFKKIHVHVGGDNSVGEIVMGKNAKGEYDLGLLSCQLLCGEIEKMEYNEGDFHVYILPRINEEKKGKAEG